MHGNKMMSGRKFVDLIYFGKLQMGANMDCILEGSKNDDLFKQQFPYII
jgi:hypothetical protein